MKKKILIITPFLMQGGVEHSLITALSGIDYEKNDVVLYLYKEELSLLSFVPEQVKVIKGFDKTHYYRRIFSIALLMINFVAKKLKLKKLEQKALSLLSGYIRKKKIEYPFKKFFRKEKFDVVISYCLHIGTEMALKIASEKYYLFLHNSQTDYHVDVFEKCVDSYDALIAVSSGVKKVYSNEYPHYEDKIKVINNYVDALEIIKKSEEYEVNVDNDDGLIFCTCGRLATEKGFDLAIEAARILKNKGYSFIWYFVGDGYYRTELEQMISNYGLESYVVITGFKENPYPYIGCCDIYIQPSYEESQGLAMYEALVLGRIVLSTDTVGGACTLDSGAKGVLVPITAQGIVDGVCQILDDIKENCSSDYQLILDENIRGKKKYFNDWQFLLDGMF